MTNNILFIADVQGSEIVKKRHITRNYNIAGNTKVFSICKCLLAHGYNITIYSPGSVAERTGRIFFTTKEHIAYHNRNIDIYYGITIDNRYLRIFTEWVSAIFGIPFLLLRNSIDTIFVYNITHLTLAVSFIAWCFGKKIFLEYEDSAVAARTTSPPLWKKIYRIHEKVFQKILAGALSPSKDLLHNLGVNNQLCLPGALSEDLVTASRHAIRAPFNSNRPLRLIYAGGLDTSKGIDRFLMAIDNIDFPLVIHVFGKGPLENRIDELCRTNRHEATFHGLVSREELVAQMVQADVGINAHRSDLHEGGSWPFKVVEYLAACGTVFSNSSADIPQDLKDNLFLYNANEPKYIKESFEAFILDWPDLSKSAPLRREWAIHQFGPEGLATKLEFLMAAKSKQLPDSTIR